MRYSMKKRIISPFIVLFFFCVPAVGCYTTRTMYCGDCTPRTAHSVEEKPWKTRTYWSAWEAWSDWCETEETKPAFVTITSSPSGTQVFVDGSLVGNTPLILKVKVPVLVSWRRRYLYQENIAGESERFRLAEGWTSTISIETEEKHRSGSRTYVLELRKEGYFSEGKSLLVPETTSLHFSLERKPTLYIKGFRVKDNVRLSWAEHLYDLIYGKRFAVDASKFGNINKNFIDVKPLTEFFVISQDQNSDYSLEGEMIIERKITEIRLALIDRAGRPITSRRTSINTKDMRDLYLKIEILIGHIKESFSKR